MTLGGVQANVRRWVVAARQAGREPIVHENGFIQLQLDAVLRLHVWPDGPIVKQRTDSPIHDHRFDISSMVLKGRLVHTEYELVDRGEDGPYHVHRVEQGRLVPSSRYVSAHVRDKFELTAGSVYSFAALRFHTSEGVDLTATLMRKTGQSEDVPARVLCPRGQVPDNDFNRRTANDPYVLWRYIERAVYS